MKKLTEKQMNKLVEAAWYKHGHGVAVNIMDIGKIFAMGRAALVAGTSLDDAMVAAAAKFRTDLAGAR